MSTWDDISSGLVVVTTPIPGLTAEAGQFPAQVAALGLIDAFL